MKLEEGIKSRNWIDSAKDRDHWTTLVNAALNLRVPLTIELVNYSNVRGLEGSKFRREYYSTRLSVEEALGDLDSSGYT